MLPCWPPRSSRFPMPRVAENLAAYKAGLAEKVERAAADLEQ